LLRIPNALKPSPLKGFQVASATGIEKYPNIPINKIITPIGPISGRAKRDKKRFLGAWRSDSWRCDTGEFMTVPKKRG
jgi:hypothetical protein